MSTKASSSALAGHVALVTGAGSGIGRGVVDRFVLEGARVVAFDRSDQALSALTEVHPEDEVVAVQGDVRSAEDNARAVEKAIAAFGSLDCFVGNAGVFDAALPLTALPPEILTPAAEEIFGINVIGYLVGAHAAAPALIERRGAMIFTASNASFEPGAGGGILYTTAKHAVVGLVRQLAYELAPDVRVNGVAPGGTMTGLQIATTLQPLAGKRDHFSDRPAAERAIGSTNPLGIVALPADHAGIYVLLAGRDAPAATGEIIRSDGGLAVRGLGLGEPPRLGLGEPPRPGSGDPRKED